MQTLAIHVRTTVLLGHRVEIVVPELPEGRTASVFVVLDEGGEAKRPLWEVLGDYRGGELLRFAAEADAYLKAERDSWHQ